MRNFGHLLKTLLFIMFWSHWAKLVGRRGVPGAPQVRCKTSSGAPMGSQICPSGSKKCAKWVRGCENDTQSGLKRGQLVPKGDHSGPKVVPKVPSRVPIIQRQTEIVVQNWRAFCNAFQCLWKCNLQAEWPNCTTVWDWKSLSGGGLSSKVSI